MNPYQHVTRRERGGNLLNDGFSILPKANVLVTIISKDDSTYSKAVLPVESDANEWSCWGDGNDFPQKVLEDLDKNSIALRALDKRRRIHFGRGIIAYREKHNDKTGALYKEIVKDPEVVYFFRTNQINRQWSDLIYGLEIFANGWLEMICNKGKDKINKVVVKDPAYCRISKMDKKGRINHLFYSAQWTEGTPSTDNGTIVKIPMWNPSKYDGKEYGDDSFVYPVFYKSFNKSYYHMAIWNGVRTGGWMDISNNVPRLKKAIMANQMTLKYHVQIPFDYFEKQYPSPQFTKEARDAKMKDKLEEIEEFLTDLDNSGKSIFSLRYWDPITKTFKDGWKIDTIDNKLKDDAYLPDSQAANSEILFAMGVDPSLIGSGIPGGSLGAGSGSNKREAYWMMNADMGGDRVISLQPLYFIRDFNRWDPDIKFDYAVVDTSQNQTKNPKPIEKRVDHNSAMI